MLFSSGMMSGDINQSPYSRRHRKSSSENSEEDRVSIPGLTVKAVQLEHLGATCVEFFGKFCWYVQGSFKSQLDNPQNSLFQKVLSDWKQICIIASTYLHSHNYCTLTHCIILTPIDLDIRSPLSSTPQSSYPASPSG